MALTKAFLAGQILTPRSIVNQWPALIESTLPLCGSQVTDQFNDELTQLDIILNATPNPKLNPELVLMPIDLVNDIKITFENFQYEYGGKLPTIEYDNVTNLVNSVFDNYSAQFYATSQPPNGWYIY